MAVAQDSSPWATAVPLTERFSSFARPQATLVALKIATDKVDGLETKVDDCPCLSDEVAELRKLISEINNKVPCSLRPHLGCETDPIDTR